MSVNNITYDSSGRMKYNPEFHDNQGKAWTVKDQKFLIENYEAMGPERLSYDLGRTFTTIANRAYELRKSGLMKPRKKRNRH